MNPKLGFKTGVAMEFLCLKCAKIL